MSIDALQQLVDNLGPSELSKGVVAFGSTVALGLLGSLAVPALRRRALPRITETRLIDYLPFAEPLEDGVTLRCKDGALSIMLAIPGAPTAAMERQELFQLRAARQAWIESLQASGVTTRVFAQRRLRRLPIAEGAGHPARARLMRAYNRRFLRSYETHFRAVLTVPGDDDRARQRLNEALRTSCEILTRYHARALALEEGALEFWAYLLNPANLDQDGNAVVGRERHALDEALYGGAIDLHRDSGLLEFHGGEAPRYARLIGIQRPGRQSSEALLADLLALEAEITVCQQVVVIPDGEAELMVKRKGDQAASVVWASNGEQFGAALRLLASGSEQQQKLCRYQLTVLAIADSPEELEEAETAIRRVLASHQVRPITETLCAGPTFFSLLPTFDERPRETHLFSANVADLVAFEQPSQGLARCDWGPSPVALLPTAEGGAYGFAFHTSEEREAPGHTIVFGPTGAGKTTALTFLATAALERFADLRVFYLDRGYSALTWALRYGARYITFSGPLGPGVQAARLQPFQQRLDGSSRQHLSMLLRLMAGGEDETLAMIDRAMQTLATLDPADRRIEVLAEACFPPGSDARRRLERWIGDGPYGGVFASGTDFELGQDRAFAIDLSTALADPDLAAPIVEEIFWRIDQVAAATGDPTLVIVDECRSMLEHPIFRAEFVRRLREGRRKRQVICACFQDPRSLEGFGPAFASDVRTNAPTHLFFRSRRTREDDFASWGLTEGEQDFLRGDGPTAHLSHAMLVRKEEAGDSVVIDLNLSGIGQELGFFAGGDKSRRRALACYACHGEAAWAEQYLLQMQGDTP
ncbi:Type IV secretory pathway, VirB4 component [Tistlia consotensis]|uniref:Type IV secretory pathway, VirB4 component n=1 Tax=Tistlia consotensis USBA 355 TaxID=560819 RepID=A0A1Y6CW20_9PROT|nr:hypothetical protein [Tistlia consotensis]SMF81936.1 Type IV secretory pathway, VirB4 component [Tistlia consotensis USBA 355]SNS24917.1 Type IV secretory pathway, VirB4 component [Tistlia consotensis]